MRILADQATYQLSAVVALGGSYGGGRVLRRHLCQVLFKRPCVRKVSGFRDFTTFGNLLEMICPSDVNVDQPSQGTPDPLISTVHHVGFRVQIGQAHA